RASRALHPFPTRRSSDLGERPAQAAPQRRMAVAPRRTDDQAEDDDLHAGTVSLSEKIFAPQLPTRSVLTPAGLISMRWKASSERSEEHTSELQSRFDLVC